MNTITNNNNMNSPVVYSDITKFLNNRHCNQFTMYIRNDNNNNKEMKKAEKRLKKKLNKSNKLTKKFNNKQNIKRNKNKFSSKDTHR